MGSPLRDACGPLDRRAGREAFRPGLAADAGVAPSAACQPMLTAFLAVVPVFAVIGAGYAAGRFGWMGPTASGELNRFVIALGLPAMLFLVMAEADWGRLWQPGFVAAFVLGACLMLLAVMAWRLRRGEGLTAAALQGLNAGYANVGYMGFSICGAVFGPGSVALVSVATILTASVVLAVALTLMEAGRQAEAHPLRLGLRVGASLLRNPVVAAPLLGAAWAMAGITMPESLASVARMLGAAASPCALLAIGLFFALPAARMPEGGGLPIGIAALKLLGQPLLAWLLGRFAFGVEGEALGVLVLLSALPTGTGAFMLADRYRTNLAATSRVILLSTAASVLTLTALIMALGLM